MRFCYADPPYVGCASLYKDQPEYTGEIDHEALIATLCDEFPDGWALSCHSPSLKTLLPMCPDDIRVAAWVKPFCSFKPNVNPAYAWEPVLFRGGRKGDRNRKTIRDWVSAIITLKKGLPGAKPWEFCWWLFDILGFEDGDDLVDMFPGTGIVLRQLEQYLKYKRGLF